MIVDGRAIAGDIYRRIREEVKGRENAPRLAVVAAAPNFETRRYLALKETKAAAVGIILSITELKKESGTEEVITAIAQAAENTDGVVVQLPLPAHIDTEAVLRSIPVTHDVDALGSATEAVQSPVVAACREVLTRYAIELEGKQAVVIGRGRLVGIPAAKWLAGEGAQVATYNREDTIDPEVLRSADIVVTGAGDPGFLKPSMVKSGVVILDAGTSEAEGELRGDADPACAEKAALFTPVPGGIGPITVACLLQNLLILTSRVQERQDA